MATDLLDSWKQISAYLHRDIRNVQRWETAEGLPLRRHFHQRVLGLRVQVGDRRFGEMPVHKPTTHVPLTIQMRGDQYDEYGRGLALV